MSSKEGNESIPALVQFWRRLYHRIPPITFFSNLSLSFAISSALVFFLVRLVAQTILLEYLFDWPPSHVLTKESAASTAAIFHSCNLVPGLCVAFWCQPYSPSQQLSAAPRWWQEFVDALLQFCTGYMINDGIFIILTRWGEGDSLTASDYMFLGHHLATSLYMTSARLVQAGHMSAMMLMLLGEATNPLHNSHLIGTAALSLDCCNGARMQQTVEVVGVLFAGAYCLFRILLGPLAAVHITYDLLVSKTARTFIPLLLRLAWLAMMWAVIFGSIPWINECIEILQKRFFDLEEAIAIEPDVMEAEGVQEGVNAGEL